MDIFKVKSEDMYKCYRNQKQSVSNTFMRAFIKFSIFTIVSWEFFFLFNYNFFSLAHLMNLFLIAISSGANYYVKKSNAAYVLGILFITIMDFRILYVAFWKFPDCLGIMIAMSVHLLCHGILEFVYHSALGYFAIVFHTAIWTYAAFASGYIKQNVPVDMKFAMGILLALQLLWYTYKIQKDYEEIKSKLQIKAEQENIQNLVNVIPEGIAVTTQSLEIIMKNSSFDKLLKSCSIFEMKSFSNNTTNQNAIFCKFRNKMEMFRNSEDFEMNFGVWNNGTNFLECTGSKTEWNLLPALVFTFREVSNLIELQKEADFTSKALKILQGVSHELKTPLNLMIHGHEDALFTSKDLSKEVKVHIKKSLSVSYYILSLTKDMIDYSHMKFNNMALEITWVRLDEVLKESVKIMENMNEKCKVVVKKQEKEIFAYTDVCRLKQCLLSFVSTALG